MTNQLPVRDREENEGGRYGGEKELLENERASGAYDACRSWAK